MNKQEIYRLLEEKMLSYTDYADIPVRPNSEPLVPIKPSRYLAARQVDRAMLAVTGAEVYVRRGVLARLRKAAAELAKFDTRLQLEVAYGYRTLAIQTKLFEQNKVKLQDKYSGKELLAAVHRLVAVPDVAGHPAGAAVDIQILRGGAPLDFGTKIHEFAPDTFTFSPFISPGAWANRQLLRRLMMAVGFAPFDGEWWHFSYGDKEWAKYYRKNAAIYKQLTVNAPIER